MNKFFLVVGYVSIIGSVLFIAWSLFLNWRQVKREALSQLVETPGGLYVAADPKRHDYDAVKDWIDTARTKEDLFIIEDLLQGFKRKYGKCEAYCNLYGDYYLALINYTDLRTY